MNIPFFGNKNRKTITDIEQKNSTRDIDLGDPNFKLFGYSTAGKMQWHEIANYFAWSYYMQVSVIYSAIDIISQSFCVIKPRIFDTEEKRFLTGDDKRIPVYALLELLNAPSSGTTYNEFCREEVPNYLATGDLYYRVKAMNEDREPSEIEIINSKDIYPEQDDEEGNAFKYTINFPGGTEIFIKDEKTGRFFNVIKTRELWHTRIFNPLSKIKGLSPLNPIFYEIEQFIASSIHNGNLLKQGARPSGIFTIDPELNLSDEQYTRLKMHLRNFIQGEGGAGNVFISQGGQGFKELSVSNKDMDFATLKKTTVEQMYRNLKIPMSLILSESMTLDNFKLAMPVLYRMAVLPLADILFEELNLFLMHRYDDTERYVLTYNPKDIPALQVEFNQEIDRLIKTQLITVNEGRKLLDMLPLIGEAGNEIVRHANLLPIGQVQQEKKLTKAEYSDLLRQNNFTEKQINEYIEKYYE